MSSKRLGVLLSGRGTNFVAIATAIERGTLPECEIAVVVSNVTDAPGLQEAQSRGLQTAVQVSKGVPRKAHDQAMIALLQDQRVDLVVLAGYMRLLSPEFVRAFPERIVNIHPSLLPAFPGLHAQKQALEYGAQFAGCTVHFVDEDVDHGVIIMQKTLGVLDDDNELSLSTRILAEEHKLYPRAIERVLSGEYEVRGRRYVRRDAR